ncbi:hypothetical protein K7X08_009095 [Anisodus acutangulus]|uniref:Phytocyanin domain-containing protein n=1 Tax=Anisodus acutangulus TaxID=402998 RepID=A0A9Q1RT62_9SOLA|nr:hypothetical protein K7X08_009095 [Anisodus acutangulus]
MSGKLEGSAIFLVILMMLFITVEITDASTTYNVGDGNDWTLGVSNWPSGKNFKAGDVLVSNLKTLAAAQRADLHLLALRNR